MAKSTKKRKESAEEQGFEETLERLEAVVERLGGTLTFRSSPEEGTTVEVCLPHAG